MMTDPIYLDHNATTPILPEVVDAMVPYLREHFGNPSSSHVYGVRVRDAVARAREQVAAMLGCDAREIIFTSGGTEANNLAIRGVTEALESKGHVVTTVIEHPATSRPCAWLERHGRSVTRIGVDADGRARVDQAREAIDGDTALVTVMHSNNETGVLQPIAELAAGRQLERYLALHGITAAVKRIVAPDINAGEFLLSHPNIRTPELGRYLSVNDSYYKGWEDPVKALMRYYRGLDGQRESMSVRYVGSLVADFHRNLLGGGIFCYPANTKSPNGKLRLLYEANPLAFIAEQAGGGAIDGRRRILEVPPTELHQRTPLFIGSKLDVDAAERFLAGVPSGVGA